MNDPYVVALKDRLMRSETLGFNNPSDVEVNTPGFQDHLSSDLLTLEPKRHYSVESYKVVLGKVSQSRASLTTKCALISILPIHDGVSAQPKRHLMSLFSGISIGLSTKLNKVPIWVATWRQYLDEGGTTFRDNRAVRLYEIQ